MGSRVDRSSHLSPWSICCPSVQRAAAAVAQRVLIAEGAQMDYTIDGYNPLSAIFFTALVLIGPIFTLKLFVAGHRRTCLLATRYCCPLLSCRSFHYSLPSGSTS